MTPGYAETSRQTRPGGSAMPLVGKFSDALVPSGWQWENEKSIIVQ